MKYQKMAIRNEEVRKTVAFQNEEIRKNNDEIRKNEMKDAYINALKVQLFFNRSNLSDCLGYIFYFSNFTCQIVRGISSIFPILLYQIVWGIVWGIVS